MQSVLASSQPLAPLGPHIRAEDLLAPHVVAERRLGVADKGVGVDVRGRPEWDGTAPPRSRNALISNSSRI
jgi:hypothetical protein